MNQQTKNPEQLATAVLKTMLGMFPTMSAMKSDVALMYSNEMARAIALNNKIGVKEVGDGIKYLRSGKYTSAYAPSIPQFISMCKANISAVKYLPRCSEKELTEEQKEKSKIVGNKALAEINRIFKK